MSEWRFDRTGGLAIALGAIWVAAIPAAETIHDASSARTQAIMLVRTQLRSGQVDAALKNASVSLQGNPGDPHLLSLLGEVLFRQSKFEKAEEVYRQTLQADPRFPRAHWGLGRLLALRSKVDEARRHYSKAYQNDPRDPDLILSFANFLEDEVGKSILYRNFLALSDPADLIRREDIASKLEIANQLRQRPLARRVSPYQPSHFKLTGSAAPDSPQGLLLAVRINGGKPLRLVVDTGASGLYLNAAALPKDSLEILSEARIGGLGAARANAGHVILARTVTIGDLVLENCIARALKLDWLAGADGVIGTDFFEEFVVRIDAQARSLDLQPISAGEEIRQSNALRIGHYLLVRASANGGEEGVYVLDTGGSFTLVQSDSQWIPPIGSQIAVRGLRGNVGGSPAGTLRFAIGQHLWTDPNGISADLSEWSRQMGIQISGILGYPLLRLSILTINYKSGTVDIAHRSR